MTYVCKNRCIFDAFAIAGVRVVSRQGYGKGTIKYCVECCYFGRSSLLACPCCGRRFRVKSKKRVRL